MCCQVVLPDSTEGEMGVFVVRDAKLRRRNVKKNMEFTSGRNRYAVGTVALFEPHRHIAGKPDT